MDLSQFLTDFGNSLRFVVDLAMGLGGLLLLNHLLVLLKVSQRNLIMLLTGMSMAAFNLSGNTSYAFIALGLMIAVCLVFLMLKGGGAKRSRW